MFRLNIIKYGHKTSLRKCYKHTAAVDRNRSVIRQMRKRVGRHIHQGPAKTATNTPE